MDTRAALDRFLAQLRADGRSQHTIDQHTIDQHTIDQHTIDQYARHVRLLAGWAAQRCRREDS